MRKTKERLSRRVLRARLRRLREAVFKPGGADALLVTNLKNIRYLSGFSGTTAMMLVAQDASFFFSDFRYRTQAKSEVKGSRFVEVERDYLESVVQFMRKRRLRSVGVEGGHMTLSTLAAMRKLARGGRLRFRTLRGAVERLRMVKDEAEVDTLRAALRIACRALEKLLPRIRPGVRESDLAAELEYLMRRGGGEGVSFDTIVASGPRGALPHGVASNRKIRRGEFVIVDFGTLLHGYCSDTTRTFHVGRPTAEAKKIYRTVLDAQCRAIEGVRPGMPMKKVDALARDYIRKCGYAKNFGHGLGHGVGLDIHEAPTVSTKGKERVEPGMVFTVEPGIYLPRKGGVRIEDVVAVGPKGRVENLTRYPKELVVV
ncbi:MAG: aminopeptidase P family protein [Acidobacteriota bacterium]|nr:MAG: aminopeptidase P family protein [Acidobacteriota bacterium]UCF81460.1 MAG: aminopeptidase P family protein [Acidobacteriota bacterium]